MYICVCVYGKGRNEKDFQLLINFIHIPDPNGGWGEFAWSDCSATCEGTRNGARECGIPSLQGAEPACPPDTDGVTNMKTEPCNVGVECPGEKSNKCHEINE